MQLASFWPIAAGPFAGSVAAVMVRRLPSGRPVALARSACEACGKALAPWDMVPLASFAALRGRCRHCGAPIAAEHLWIELAATAIAALAAAGGARGGQLWADCVFGWMLLPLAIIDWRHFRLPDALTLPLLLMGLAVTAALDGPALTEHAVASALAYAAFRLLAVSYRAWRGRDGLGQGDAKLAAAIGAWLGLAGLADTLLAGASLGLAYGLGRVLAGRARVSEPIPFGPFLALGAFLATVLFPTLT